MNRTVRLNCLLKYQTFFYVNTITTLDHIVYARVFHNSHPAVENTHTHTRTHNP